MLKGLSSFNQFPIVPGENRWGRYSSSTYSAESLVAVDNPFMAPKLEHLTSENINRSKKHGNWFVILTTSNPGEIPHRSNYQYFMKLVPFLGWNDKKNCFAKDLIKKIIFIMGKSG